MKIQKLCYLFLLRRILLLFWTLILTQLITILFSYQRQLLDQFLTYFLYVKFILLWSKFYPVQLQLLLPKSMLKFINFTFQKDILLLQHLDMFFFLLAIVFGVLTWLLLFCRPFACSRLFFKVWLILTIELVLNKFLNVVKPAISIEELPVTRFRLLKIKNDILRSDRSWFFFDYGWVLV